MVPTGQFYLVQTSLNLVIETARRRQPVFYVLEFNGNCFYLVCVCMCVCAYHMHIQRSEDSLRSQSLPSPWFETGSLVHCCIHQAGWPMSFQEFSHYLSISVKELWDYRHMLLHLAGSETWGPKPRYSSLCSKSLPQAISREDFISMSCALS